MMLELQKLFLMLKPGVFKPHLFSKKYNGELKRKIKNKTLVAYETERVDIKVLCWL